MVSVNNLTRRKTPVLNYRTITEKILGREYDLSIAFISSKQSKYFNRQYRKKNKPANVLAFRLGPASGEILVDLAEIENDYQLTKSVTPQSLTYILIHAMLHLKGYVHGSTMEREEKRVMKALKLKLSLDNESSYRHRPGHRHGFGSSRRVRI